MTKFVKEKDLGWKKFVREINSASNAFVDIGIHSQQGDIAEYAAYNEYGTSKIPERSFMRSTFDEQLSATNAQIAKQYKLVTEGKQTAVRALGLIGLRFETKVKDKIQSNIPPKNADSTIARKGSSRTLIDTGAMLNNVRYVIGKK